MFSHAGYSQYYVLESTPFSPSSGPYAFGMRSGTFYEQEPRGDFVQAFLSQTGRLGRGVTSVSLLTSSALFELSLNGQAIDMRPVGLDPASPTYPEDVLAYVGEWTGDVSAFAGHMVDLRITDLLPSYDFSALVVDEIQFLPVSEASTAWLFGLGFLTVLLAARRGPERRRPHDPNIPMLEGTPTPSFYPGASSWPTPERRLQNGVKSNSAPRRCSRWRLSQRLVAATSSSMRCSRCCWSSSARH